jgi:pimeloyl-ACP methyl ester carboxylesterase
MSGEIDHERRRFFGTMAMTIAAVHFGISRPAVGQTSTMKPASLPPTKAGTNKSFGPLKRIDAGVLNVGYADAGPTDGPPVILLHGWPYDIHSFVDVTPLLAKAGYRVIVPYVRGYGTTRFLSNDTVRNGQPSALAVDTIAFMDALKIDKAILAGFDWGARTANIVAALWPERCKAMVSVSGYLIDYPSRRCRRRAASRPQFVCQEILGQILAPPDQRRHRPQSAPRSAAGLRPGCRRCRQVLIGGENPYGIHESHLKSEDRHSAML